MNNKRFDEITGRYSTLRLAVVGDFCLDRYLEIDPLRTETSIETGLPVHNVMRVRAQAGAAGTVVNNLVALGIGTIFPVGFCGVDGEGFELRQALGPLRGIKMDYFLATPLRRTFCYCKPLVLSPGQPPRELERLDSKNWTPTPPQVVQSILKAMSALCDQVDAVIVMDQVDEPETGVVAAQVREALTAFQPKALVIADSRRGLGNYPRVIFKMNAAELGVLAGYGKTPTGRQIENEAKKLAQRNDQAVIVTMAERGIVGAQPDGRHFAVPALPLRGPIDVVGAGDSVTANVAAGLAGGATLKEALELAMAASSIAIHQLGTTGTASVAQLRDLLFRKTDRCAPLKE